MKSVDSTDRRVYEIDSEGRNEMLDVHFVTGVVGGSGKTMFSRALIDYLLYRKKIRLIVVEGDGQNSDIFDVYEKANNKEVILKRCKLFAEIGWVTLFNDLEDNAGVTTVINAGAQNLDSIQFAADEGFLKGFYDLDRRCVTWWLITSTPTTTELLANFLDAAEAAGELPGPVHVVRNAGAGNRTDFEFFDEEMRSRVRAIGGKEVEMPTLTTEIVHKIESGDIELNALSAKLQAGDRIRFNAWRNRVYRSIEKALDDG